MEDEEKLESFKKECKEKLLRLNNNEDFKFFKSQVVDPTVAQLEAELASAKADELPEAILRGKLKHLNSLRFFFKDVFLNINN